MAIGLMLSSCSSFVIDTTRMVLSEFLYATYRMSLYLMLLSYLIYRFESEEKSPVTLYLSLIRVLVQASHH